MLKLGIYKLSHDTRAYRVWRRGQSAATLLNAHDANDVTRFERLMAQISLANGVARTTSRHRFLELDAEVEHYLRSVFPNGSPVTVEDCAVSSGEAAAEWYHRLQVNYPDVRFTASDSTLYFIEATREREGDTFIVQPDGIPIQYIRPPFVVSLMERQHWLYPVNRLVQSAGERVWQQLGTTPLSVPTSWADMGHEVSAESSGPFVLRRIPLLHPTVLREQSETFVIRQRSIFVPLAEPVDVFRTMNILNHAYFDHAQLRDGIAAVTRSVRDGSVWIVGRTVMDEPPQHTASVFRRMSGSWSLEFRIGAGSEIESLVLAEPMPESGATNEAPSGPC